MGLAAWSRRRRARLAGNLALLLAAGTVLGYAVNAQGYQSHQAQLNDGGIWVTSSRDGSFGRINKPIGQLDAALFGRLDSDLDVVQDGSAVVGIDESQGLIKPIDPATVRHPEGEEAAVPGSAGIGLAGGTLAVLDPVSGKAWAQRVDPAFGTPSVSAVDSGTTPALTAGHDAALAVSQAGDVLAVSAAEDTLTRLDVAGAGYDHPRTVDLPDDVGIGASVTAVGDTAVVLDPQGTLSVVDGPHASVPEGSVLQQSGPASAAVLVDSPAGLLSVDLSSGAVTTLADGSSGRPAAPVRLGACAYGAWSGGSGAVATVCEGNEPVVALLGGSAADLVFRVNRGEIVLNDRSSGAVWNIDSDEPTRIDDWESFRQEQNPDKDKNQNEVESQGDLQPPKAKPDDFGARPGRTTVLHPLDNDTAPEGRLLAIQAVKDVGGKADVTISPDGQTIQIRLDDGAVTGASFEYFIDDGREGMSAHAGITVNVREPTENVEPQLREGFQAGKEWTVPASGALDLPVLPDWRDRADGDPVSLVSANVVGAGDSGATARTTAGGLVRFLAPPTGGTFTVAYFVTDGLGGGVRNELRFKVQDRSDRRAVPATAEPDIVAGEAGSTITIRPLGNDLPGSDPVSPDAELTLAGRVDQPGGTKIVTDLVDGTLSFVADRPRTYFLAYDAAYGNAPLATGKIRVDVRAAQPDAPVAMPDNVTVYGQASSLVDVLANDVDPAGGMIVVQRADPVTDNQLDVAVVDGRWLRIGARQGQIAPNPQIVRYSITNGTRSGIEGEVVVNQQPAPVDNTPVTEPDRVTVRAGAAVSIAVLDNDFSPSGDALSLVSHLTDETAGQLEVQVQGDQKVPTGQAFVAGRLVRYVAPADLAGTQTFVVPYLATNADGGRAPGRAEVTVVPQTRRNQPPAPPVLEGRVVAGDTLLLKLPGAQVDPDGDAVTVLGIATAPTLGRVVKYGANSIEYQAYPGSAGTDEFTYALTDPAGSVSTGAVRVGVVPPGAPQPPLAVADALTVEPGRTARVDVLANDLVAAGDRVRVRLVDPPAGVKLVSETGPVVVPAPDRVDGRTVEVVYAVDNGMDSSQTTITLRTARPYNNPPVVFDAFGAPDDAPDDASGADGEVKVDVLKTAYDPDGPGSELRITDVFAPTGVQARSDGSEVTVQRGPEPVVVPFRVEDADGGAATASLFVPAAGSGPPFVKADGLIRLDPGETRTVRLSDYVVNPSGAPLMLTYRDRIWPSPEATINAAVTGEQTFEVTADEKYVGPGAVAFEVTTGTSVGDPEGVRSVLSVPVQVGDPVPIMRCPDDVVDISQAEAIELDVAALCHVWTADPAELDDLRFEADWTTSVPGLSIIEPSGPVIEVAAAGDAKPGAEARLTVSTGDSEPGEVRIRVVKSPPPSLAPIRIADMRAGESRTVDLARYLTPGVGTPHPTVVRIAQVSGLDVQAVKEGDSAVTITTGAKVDGVAQFSLTMSDVAGASGPERQVQGRITLEILDVPDVPKAPVPGQAVRSQEVHLEWAPPQANGAPIDLYEVRASDGSVKRCGISSCDITGLVNGRPYTFQVRARNAVGTSDWSPSSRPATPDMLPGQVGTIQAGRIGDGTVTIRWTKPTTQTSAIKRYLVSWPGGNRVTTGPSLTISGLDNNQSNAFTVQAENDFGIGPKRVSESVQTVGTPGTPAAPTITDQQTAGDQGAVSLTWSDADPNGPTPVTYTVFRNGSPLPRCTDTQATSCDDSGITYDGTRYTYKVRATNGGNKTSPFGGSSSWDAVGQPADWGDWGLNPTGADNQARADFTVPGSRGARSDVRIYADGALVDQFDGAGAQSRDLGVADNDVPHDVYLQVCNEKGACTDSSHRSVQTYGPLAAAHISAVQGHVSGTDVYWSFTVDANGDPASVTVTSSQGWTQSFSATSVNTSSFSTTSRDLGYSQSERITVTLSDPAPNRGPVSQVSGTVTTADPPAPTVAVSRGASCGPRAGSNPCTTNPAAQDCLNASCGRVVVTLANFTSSVTCTINSSTGGGFGTYGPFGNGAHQLTAYYGFPGGWVQATCGGVVSPRYTWPNG